MAALAICTEQVLNHGGHCDSGDGVTGVLGGVQTKFRSGSQMWSQVYPESSQPSALEFELENLCLAEPGEGTADKRKSGRNVKPRSVYRSDLGGFQYPVQSLTSHCWQLGCHLAFEQRGQVSEDWT